MVRVAIFLLPMLLPATAWALITFMACVLMSSAAMAQKRIALVIGNSAYQHTPQLANPKNDAADIAAALKKHGFEIVQGLDLDKAGFDRKVRDFALALKGAEDAVFFYAGHGMQVNGQNFLVPVDAKAETAETLDLEMVRLSLVQRIMEQLAGTNILFLDACRNNPLARKLARAIATQPGRGTRSTEIGDGLKTVESSVGTLISFSTAPETVAADGEGRNSPYAGALARRIAASEDDLTNILVAVRNEVIQVTRSKQIPWEHSAMVGRFYFGAPPKANAATEAAAAWEATKSTTTIATLETFITRYRDTHFATLARARIDEIVASNAIDATTEHPFDGYWLVRVTKSTGCSARPWSYRFGIKRSIIYGPGRTKLGAIKPNGRFEYERENSNHPSLRVKIVGTLRDKLGTAKFVTGTCHGEYAIAGEGRLPQIEGSGQAVAR